MSNLLKLGLFVACLVAGCSSTRDSLLGDGGRGGDAGFDAFHGCEGAVFVQDGAIVCDLDGGTGERCNGVVVTQNGVSRCGDGGGGAGGMGGGAGGDGCPGGYAVADGAIVCLNDGGAGGDRCPGAQPPVDGAFLCLNDGGAGSGGGGMAGIGGAAGNGGMAGIGGAAGIGGNARGGSGGAVAGSGGNAGASGQGGAGGGCGVVIGLCARPYECIATCGGPLVTNDCCPCQAPLFDNFGDTACRNMGTPTITYVGCNFVGGYDRVVVSKKDARRDLCVNVVLTDRPGSAASGLTLWSSSFGVESVSAGPAAACPTRNVLPRSGGSVTGTVTAPAGTASMPQSVSFDLTVQIPSGDAGPSLTETLSGTNVATTGGCL